MTPTGWQADVLKFWFGLKPEQHWQTDDALDRQIREQFRDLWSKKRQLPAHGFLDQALSALAAVILFDQFPRNMFRGHAEQFATDPLALGIAGGAVDKGLDDALEHGERSFLYMPFEHSEDIADQNRALILFTALGDRQFLDFAKKHHAIIERFGRFPHRNAMLGRTPHAQEIAAGDIDPF
ncbi:MAG: DUF924 family protein [Sphingomicrobium sp.]